MGYHLEAILAHSETLNPTPAWIADSKVVALDRGIRMIPMTDALHDGLQGTDPVVEKPYSEFVHLSAPLVNRLTELSRRGPVAYVEADYFGGVGGQCAVVWQDGKLALGPLHEGRVINWALRVLGVKRGLLHDEFETAGLNRHRHMDEW